MATIIFIIFLIFRIRMTNPISDPEKVNYLFKKALGLQNAKIAGEYDTENPNPSRWTIYTSQTFQQPIPTSAPTDLQSVSTSDPQILYKSNSIQYPYIAKYSVLMTQAAGGGNLAFRSPYLNNAISEQLDPLLSYKYLLFATSNGNCNILQNIEKYNGYWLADPDSGVVAFYDYTGITYTSPSFIINAQKPPVITFYRYEGVIGPNTFQSVEYF